MRVSRDRNRLDLFHNVFVINNAELATEAFMWKKVEKNIYRRGPYSYLVRLMVNGKKVDETLDSLEDAKIYRDKHLHSAALDVHKTAIIESRIKKRSAKNYTLTDAIKDYRKEKSEKKKGWATEGARLNLILRLPIANESLYMVHRDALISCLSDIRSGKGQRIKGVKKRAVSEATVKRYYNLLRHIFQIAKDEWKKIDVNPFDELAASERPKDGKPRDRRFQGDEYQRLRDELVGEARVALVVFVETAMRKGELLALDWQYIKFKGKFGSAHLPETKTDEARAIPLSSTATAELKSLMPGRVKPISGKVFKISSDALRYQWRKARMAIGAPDLRIHDLRHEATSRLFEDKGFNVIEAAAVTGHKNLQMLKRYTHLDPTQLAKKLG